MYRFYYRRSSVSKIKPEELPSKGESLLPENNPIEGEARYIRITVKGNSLNNWASITSIDVCGTDISRIPPEPRLMNI